MYPSHTLTSLIYSPSYVKPSYTQPPLYIPRSIFSLSHISPFHPSIRSPHFSPKVLTADADKAILPYQRSSGGIPPLPKHIEACRRLYPFRQPIGFAIVRILDERTSRLEERTSRLPLDERTEHHLFSRSLKITPIKCTFYAMKQTFNDSTLGRYGIVWWIQFGCYLYLLHYTTLHYTTT